MGANRAMSFGMKAAFACIGKDPDRNLPKLLQWVDRFAGNGPDSFQRHRDTFRRIMDDPQSGMHRLLWSVWEEIDEGVLQTVFENFLINANLTGWPLEQQLRRQYSCCIPWAIGITPELAGVGLSFDALDGLITQGKALGAYCHLYCGGEPLLRCRELIAIARKHHDCVFAAVTDGKHINEKFADDLLSVENMIPVLLVEGTAEARELENTMELLRQGRLPFGICCRYDTENALQVVSDAFLDRMIARGAKFAWYSCNWPGEADTNAPTPWQREYVRERLRLARREKPIFAADFRNFSEYVGGCVAGGRRYLHIRADGEAAPCFLLPGTGANIEQMPLLDILQSEPFQCWQEQSAISQLLPCARCDACARHR